MKWVNVKILITSLYLVYRLYIDKKHDQELQYNTRLPFYSSILISKTWCESHKHDYYKKAIMMFSLCRSSTKTSIWIGLYISVRVMCNILISGRILMKDNKSQNTWVTSTAKITPETSPTSINRCTPLLQSPHESSLHQKHAASS